MLINKRIKLIGLKSYRNGGGPQACLGSSSELSPQSSFPSQMYALNTHFELLHLKKPFWQATSPQVGGSSLSSSQSGCPSQCQDLGIQIADWVHWNCFSASHWSGANEAVLAEDKQVLFKFVYCCSTTLTNVMTSSFTYKYLRQPSSSLPSLQSGMPSHL